MTGLYEGTSVSDLDFLSPLMVIDPLRSYCWLRLHAQKTKRFVRYMVMSLFLDMSIDMKFNKARIVIRLENIYELFFICTLVPCMINWQRACIGSSLALGGRTRNRRSSR